MYVWSTVKPKTKPHAAVCRGTRKSAATSRSHPEGCSSEYRSQWPQCRKHPPAECLHAQTTCSNSFSGCITSTSRCARKDRQWGRERFATGIDGARYGLSWSRWWGTLRFPWPFLRHGFPAATSSAVRRHAGSGRGHRDNARKAAAPRTKIQLYRFSKIFFYRISFWSFWIRSRRTPSKRTRQILLRAVYEWCMLSDAIHPQTYLEEDVWQDLRHTRSWMGKRRAPLSAIALRAYGCRHNVCGPRR